MNFNKLLSVVSVVVLSVFLAGCGGGGDQNQTQESVETTSTSSSGAGNGKLVATVNFEGSPPEPETYDASGNSECSKNTLKSRKIVINDNETLKNVVVAVKSGPSELDRKPDPVTIDQVNCMYKPHVATAKVGQSIEYKDSDPSMHNVRAIKKGGSQVFNITTFKGKSKSKGFSSPGVYSLECNVHPWMQGWVYVTDLGVASVTGESGKATLSNLPAGDYTLEFWHEEYGSKTETVTIDDGGPTSVSVTFSS